MTKHKVLQLFCLCKAFTLIELMVVVMILGILASTSLPLYTRYIRRSKTTEVYLNLRKIYDGQWAYYAEEIVNASGSALPKRFVATRIEPPWPPGVEKKPGNFDGGNWPLLRFTSDSALQYCYMADAYPFPVPYPWRPAGMDVTSDPPQGISLGMQVSAAGDLDGDGEFSYFSRNMGIKPDGTVEAMPAIFALDRLE